MQIVIGLSLANALRYQCIRFAEGLTSFWIISKRRLAH